MKILNLFKKTQKEIPAIITPRIQGGFEKMGAAEKPLDTRTPKQIAANLDHYAKAHPEISKLFPEIKKSAHAKLASDISELAQRKVMLMQDIDLNQKVDGESAYEHIMKNFAKTSKENPAALDFMQEILNQTDTQTSKYALLHLPGLMKNPPTEESLKAATTAVKTAAEATLDGGYTGDLSKQRDFINMLGLLTSPNSRPEKVKALPATIKIIDEISAQNPEKAMIIDVPKLLSDSRPHSQVMENLNTLNSSGLYKQMDTKTEFDIADYANKNVNLTV
jgi:hypothetical protein